MIHSSTIHVNTKQNRVQMSFQHVPYAMKIPPMEATFENFPDEILLSICRYLSQYEIFWAFHDLNHRLNCTISGYFHSMIVRENIGPDYRDRPHLLPLIGSCLRSLKIRGTHITAANIRAAPNIQELTLHYARADIIPVSDLREFIQRRSTFHACVLDIGISDRCEHYRLSEVTGSGFSLC